MKARWTFLAAAVALLVALSVGFALAARSQPTWGEQMDRMHASATMRPKHAQMPAELQGAVRRHVRADAR